MISSYLLAAQVLEDATLGAQALQALDYLCTHLMHRDGYMFHYVMGDQAYLAGQLADQVWMVQALLDAYAMSGSKKHLETAIALMHFTCQELLDPQSGLFYDYLADPEAIGRLALREQPLTENALAAACLLRMSAYSHRKNLHGTALRVLSGSLSKYYHTGIQGAFYACVIAQASEQSWL
ncbi:hypothetical protein [Dictyobacter kobayashii]|nr:hypothetical protein [Dictyobacter kobayashii]